MADNAYQLDPFTTITDIHFGSGTYLGLIGFQQLEGGASLDANFEASFPDFEGGTPGFNIIAGTAAFPGSLPSPTTLTAKQIAGRQLISLSGQHFAGFSATAADEVSMSNGVFIPITPPLSTRPFGFNVRLALQVGVGTIGFVSINLYGKGGIKPGAILAVPTLGNAGSSPTAVATDGATNAGGPGIQMSNFVVDPVAMTVTETT